MGWFFWIRARLVDCVIRRGDRAIGHAALCPDGFDRFRAFCVYNQAARGINRRSSGGRRAVERIVDGRAKRPAENVHGDAAGVSAAEWVDAWR